MASKFFRKAFEFLGKKGPTIKGVQPTKSKAVQDKIKLIKKAGKLQKKQGLDTYKKIGVDKVTKDIYKIDVPKSLREKKMFGGRIKKKKPETKEQKSIKEKILPKKKKDRLEELRKELGMKKGGSALKPVDKQKNPGLAKLPTQVRNKMGYMKKGGSVKQMVKTVTSPITHLRNKLKNRKFGRGKK